jgi:transcriptional regulator with XRE-family HTH domain
VLTSGPKLPQLGVFGANVRRERVGRGITQEKLAESVEINPRTVQKIEAGKINILLTTVLRIQKALGCPWNDLMRDLTAQSQRRR